MTHPSPTTNPSAERPLAVFWGEDYEALSREWRQVASRRPALQPQRRRQARTPRHLPPDGLKTATQAAAKLGCSIKTLNGHVASGALKYVAIGHGKRRPRKMFANADLDEFIANQTRKVTPCPSDAISAHRSGRTTFKSEIIAFSGLQRRRRDAKPKP